MCMGQSCEQCEGARPHERLKRDLTLVQWIGARPIDNEQTLGSWEMGSHLAHRRWAVVTSIGNGQ